MNQILTTEDHTGFYTALGFSIALVLVPWLQDFITIPVEGSESLLLISTIDSMITLTTIAALITGLLYVLQPDRLGDTILRNKVMYQSWRYGDFWRIKKAWKTELLPNEALQILIAEIDRTVTNWNRTIWIPPSKSCLTVVESSINAPPIQNALWKLKRRAGVGIIFLLWGIPVLLNFLSYWYVSILISLFGFTVFIHTIAFGASKKMIERLLKTSFIGYANDALLNWQPLLRNKRDEKVENAMDRLKDSATDLERVVSSGQWERFEITYDWFLQELKSVKPHVASVDRTLQAAWCGAFANYYLERARGGDSEIYRAWFLEVLEVFRLTGELMQLKWGVIPDKDNFDDPKAFFTIQIRSDLVYKDRSNAEYLLTEAFRNSDEKIKTDWINAIAISKQELPETLGNLVYSFSCQYEGNSLTSEAYHYLSRNFGVIRDTTELLLDRIAEAKFDPKEKEQFFDRIQKSGGVSQPIRDLASRYRVKFSGLSR